MAKTDYYEVLGLSRDVQLDEIKKAYRRQAIKYHPDRNPGDGEAEEKFKEATEAYEILANPQKRQTYDQFGFAGLEGMGSAGSHDFSSVFRDFEDIFGDFTGIFDSFLDGGARRRRSYRSSVQRGSDLRYDLKIEFLASVFGKKVDISYERNDECSSCHGTGSEEGAAKKICGTCGGSGQVRRQTGFFSIATTCPACNGEGEIIKNPCRDCSGSGHNRKNRTVKVTIPTGIETGKRLTIPGQGHAGNGGGSPGNLYVYIHVEPHEYFERDRSDVYCMIPISITQAALGANIFVPTLDDEKIKVKIPSGTQNGKILRLKNEGIPHLQNPNRRGDMFIKISIKIPSKLNSRARKLLEELSGLNGENDSPKPLRLSEISG